MPETKQITFTHKEVAEALIKHAGLSEGLWGLYVEFGIAAANIGPSKEGELTPAAIVPIIRLGIQRFEDKNSLVADASEVVGKRKAQRRAQKSAA